jgi:hypothetical protein
MMQAIENQTHGFPAPMHQLAQELNEQFAVQTTHVSAEPALSAQPHRRGGGDRLPLPRSVHDRRLAAQSTGLSMNGIGAKAGSIPKQIAVLRFIVRAASLFMLLDSPGDTGGPLRYRGDNSPSVLVSQSPVLLGKTSGL